MRILKIVERVGHPTDKREYLASVDYETDITKYGDETLKQRFQTKVFSLEKLEEAENFNLFISDVKKLDYAWWKHSLLNDYSIANLSYNIKAIYKVSKFLFKRKILDIR